MLLYYLYLYLYIYSYKLIYGWSIYHDPFKRGHPKLFVINSIETWTVMRRLRFWWVKSHTEPHDFGLNTQHFDPIKILSCDFDPFITESIKFNCTFDLNSYSVGPKLQLTLTENVTVGPKLHEKIVFVSKWWVLIPKSWGNMSCEIKNEVNLLRFWHINIYYGKFQVVKYVDECRKGEPIIWT